MFDRSMMRRFLPSHPGYQEGILVQSSRQFASLAMCTAVAIALGGGHITVAIIAAIPFIARLSYLGVPALVRRHGSWQVARAGFWFERAGFFAAALAAIARPGDATLPLFLAAFGVALAGQATYDAAMAALHSEVALTGEFGKYLSEKTRWSSLAGLTLGVVGALLVDSVEALGVAPHVARAAAIITGMGIHLLLARPFARMGAIAREHALRPSRQLPAVAPRTSIMPRSREDWAVVHLALAWGFAYGIGARQTEAMAMRELGISIGSVTLLNAALVGAGVLAARTWGRLGDQFGGKGLMALAMLAFAMDPLWTLLAMYVHPVAFIPAYVLWGLFNTGWSIAQQLALVRTRGHPAERIRLITMYNVAYGLAAGIAPLLGGLLLTWADARMTTRASFATLFVVALVLRGLTVPVLLRLPAAECASARRVSTVYLRLVRAQTLRGTRAVTAMMGTAMVTAARAPRRFLPTRRAS
jgi:hypothetical protein